MIRITKQTDYGIVVMVLFASQPDGGRVSARDVASETELPPPMVGKILKALARANLLNSIRGAKGGYELARPSDQISIAEIVEALEGPIAFTQCCNETVEPDPCEHESVCPVTDHWQLINGAIKRALEGMKLSQMTRPAQTASKPRLPIYRDERSAPPLSSAVSTGS